MEVWNKQVRMQPVDITLRCLVVWIVDFVHILAIHIVLSSNLDKLLAAVNYPFSSQYFLLIPPDKIHQETKGFLMFSRGIESEHQEGKGYVGILDETFCGQIYVMLCAPLLPLVQFRKCEKHSWKSVTFIKVAGFSLQLY